MKKQKLRAALNPPSSTPEPEKEDNQFMPATLIPDDPAEATKPLSAVAERRAR